MESNRCALFTHHPVYFDNVFCPTKITTSPHLIAKSNKHNITQITSTYDFLKLICMKAT